MLHHNRSDPYSVFFINDAAANLMHVDAIPARNLVLP